MFEHIANLLKKKEALIQHRAPLFFDVCEFIKLRTPQLDGSISPIVYKNGILTLRVRSSAFIQEFHFVKDELILFLRNKKNYPIRDIKTIL